MQFKNDVKTQQTHYNNIAINVQQSWSNAFVFPFSGWLHHVHTHPHIGMYTYIQSNTIQILHLFMLLCISV